MINDVYTVVNFSDLMKHVDFIDSNNLNLDLLIQPVQINGSAFSAVLVMEIFPITVTKKRIHMLHSLTAVPVEFVRETLILTKPRVES